MKRIGGLKLQAAANITERTVDGRTPEQQILECRGRVEELESIQEQAFRDVMDSLASHGLVLKDYSELDSTRQDLLRRHYMENVFPLITPQIFDPAHPFPFISNLSLNILVTLPGSNPDENAIARVKVPVGTDVPRFVKVGKEHTYVPLEQIIAKQPRPAVSRGEGFPVRLLFRGPQCQY